MISLGFLSGYSLWVRERFAFTNNMNEFGGCFGISTLAGFVLRMANPWLTNVRGKKTCRIDKGSRTKVKQRRKRLILLNTNTAHSFEMRLHVQPPTQSLPVVPCEKVSVTQPSLIAWRETPKFHSTRNFLTFLAWIGILGESKRLPFTLALFCPSPFKNYITRGFDTTNI